MGAGGPRPHQEWSREDRSRERAPASSHEAPRAGAPPPLVACRGAPARRGAEFALSTELDRLRELGQLAVRIGGRGEGWFGLTFAEDLAEARSRLQELHASNHYPATLAK